MVGQSVSMRRIMEVIQRVAPARVSVFITGETGTGKEVAARAIHDRSGRTGPFISVNCAAIIETLIESELFGHQKGSFTGADRRHPGLVERANGGTLFLDEISEMRGEAQAKLLRVIEERRVLPVGATREIPIDVRFLAASNRTPKQAIGEERLREDLYYRLSATSIHLPPLRDRLDDLPALIDHFIKQANHDFKRQVDGVDPECLCALRTYRWPGNVRELRNVFESAVLMAHSMRLSVDDLPEEIRISTNRETSFTVSLGSPLHEIEQEYIRRTIAFAGGNKARASEMLGVPRRTLYGKLERYDARHKSNGRSSGNGHRAPRDGRNGLT
ncbi:MAG: sigma-54 dependent transcriptional regulator [Candidatus Binatus sp.]